MSIASFEREMLAELRQVTEDKKLTRNDWLEWSTTPIAAQEGELLAYLPTLRVHVAYKPHKK
jgi:hypothetical protein